MLDLDNAFHRRAFELCGMEEHFDHMLSTFQHIERLRKFSLQTEENKSVCAAHTRILEAVHVAGGGLCGVFLCVMVQKLRPSRW